MMSWKILIIMWSPIEMNNDKIGHGVGIVVASLLTMSFIALIIAMVVKVIMWMFGV